MSDNTIQDQLAALLQQANTATATPSVSGWNQPKPANAAASVQGVLVPIGVQTPMGKVRVSLAFGAEHAASPAALNALLEQLANAGLPLDAWQPQQSSGSSGWGGNNQGNGGYNRFQKRY